MPKLGNVKNNRKIVPFIDTDDIIVGAKESGKRIMEWHAFDKRRNIGKVFKVMKGNVLDAFKKVESFFGKI
jgi:hypothetical protein